MLKALGERYPEHLSEFTFALNTVLRLGSMYAATYEMIDWQRKELDMPRTKSGEAVHVPLNTNALAAIQSLPSWQERKGPIFRNLRPPWRAVLCDDHWFKPVLEAAGIANFKWHDLRHTFASWPVRNGVPLERIADLLGHGKKTGLAMTKRYAHLAPNTRHGDVALLTRNSTRVAPEPRQESGVSTVYLN